MLSQGCHLEAYLLEAVANDLGFSITPGLLLFGCFDNADFPYMEQMITDNLEF